MSELTDQLLQVWRTNCRINTMLIDAIDDEGMLCTLSTRGGRSVGRQFAHLHWLRIYHLQKRAKALAEGAVLFESKEEPERGALLAALADSERRIEDYIRYAGTGVPGIRTFKRGIAQHVAYFVAHESHHRGSVLLTLKVSGRAVDKNVRGAIWDWDRL